MYFMFRANIFSEGSKKDPYSKYRILERVTRDGSTRYIPMKRFLIFFWRRLPEYGYATIYPTCRNYNNAKYEIDRYVGREVIKEHKKLHKVS